MFSITVEMENVFHKFPKDNKIVDMNPLSNVEVELNIKRSQCDVNTVDSCYNVPIGKREKVRYNEMFIIKRCFY